MSLTIEEQVDFKEVASSKAGQVVIRTLLGECGVYRPSYTAAIDPLAMAYHEGKRAIGLFILGLFESNPNLYIELMKKGIEK